MKSLDQVGWTGWPAQAQSWCHKQTPVTVPIDNAPRLKCKHAVRDAQSGLLWKHACPQEAIMCMGFLKALGTCRHACSMPSWSTAAVRVLSLWRSTVPGVTEPNNSHPLTIMMHSSWYLTTLVFRLRRCCRTEFHSLEITNRFAKVGCRLRTMRTYCTKTRAWTLHCAQTLHAARWHASAGEESNGGPTDTVTLRAYPGTPLQFIVAIKPKQPSLRLRQTLWFSLSQAVDVQWREGGAPNQADLLHARESLGWRQQRCQCTAQTWGVVAGDVLKKTGGFVPMTCRAYGLKHQEPKKLQLSSAGHESAMTDQTVLSKFKADANSSNTLNCLKWDQASRLQQRITGNPNITQFLSSPYPAV